MMRRLVKGCIVVALFMMLWGCLGCGGVQSLSPQGNNAPISVYVKGAFCVTSEDGYTPPEGMTPMEGMGVSFAGTPLPFEAKVDADVPMFGGLRNFDIVYTAPSALCGVVVSGRVVRDHTGEGFCMVYTLSYPMPSAPLVLDVTYSQIEGLLLPLREATK